MMFHAMLVLALATGGDDKEAAEALEKFRAGMKDSSAPRRAAAATELSKTQHEKTWKALVPFLTGDVNTVRIAAAKGLGAFVEYKKQVTPVLLGALGPNQAQKEVDVVCAIYEALGKLDDDSALPQVHRGFDEKDAKIACAALAAAGEIRNLSSIDLVIELMKKLEKLTKDDGGGGSTAGVSLPGGGDDPQRVRARTVLPATIKAMQAITREKWATSGEWLIWWQRRKATFKIQD